MTEVTRIKEQSNSTLSNGRRTPSLDEVERKLANRRNSLSAILGRIYSSEPQVPNKISLWEWTEQTFLPMEQEGQFLEKRKKKKSDAQRSHASSPHL